MVSLYLHFSFLFKDSSFYYGNDGQHILTTSINQDIRSPLAATRANSLASAASPTGSACMKTEPPSDNMYMV